MYVCVWGRLIVNEIGLEATIDSLQAHWLQPIARHLFGEVGVQLDRHHSFIVAYQVCDHRPRLPHVTVSYLIFLVPHPSRRACMSREGSDSPLES